MAARKVKGLKGGRIAEDGSALDIEVETQDGEAMSLAFSFDQFSWLLQALLEQSNALYERQVSHGRLRAVEHADTMVAEGFQIVLDPNAPSALIQIAGRRAEDAPLGLGAFRVDKVEFLRKLAEQCLEAADEVERRGRLA